MTKPLLKDPLEQEIFHLYGEESRQNPYLLALISLVTKFIGEKSLAAKIDAWIALSRWVLNKNPAFIKTNEGKGLVAFARVEIFIQMLESCPLTQEKFHTAIGQMIFSIDAVNFFGETGVPTHKGFLSEFITRLFRKFLPPPRDDHDFAEFIRRVNIMGRGEMKINSLEPGIFMRLLKTSLPEKNDPLLKPFLDSYADGFRLLASKVHQTGLSKDIRSKLNSEYLHDYSFYKIIFSSNLLMDKFRKQEDLTETIAAWKKDFQGSLAELSTVKRKLEQGGGVSIDIVFSLDLIEKCLFRMEKMVSVIEMPDGIEQVTLIQSLMRELSTSHYEDNSLISLVRSNTQLLYRKIIERSGELGEHYIALSKYQYWHIWIAAGGGGLLTVFTAAIKINIYGWGLAPFQEGLMAGLNYAISFMILHFCGFVLATKQPAMTAATLAKSMNNKNRNRVIREMIDIAPKVTYTQVAAAAGNVLVVAIGAYIFSYLWLLIAGTPFMTLASAHHTYETLSPLDSGTVFYAALTGVILWLASLIGGWFDNWSRYHRIPQGIADHRLGQVIGNDRIRKVSDYYQNHNAALATNISLGLMLGMLHPLGSFFGLALDVRHVTLSTGTLALAAASLEKAWFMDGWFIKALAGIAVMFVLNLGVSFYLSLFSAMRAYRWSLKESLDLTGKLLWRFVKAPWEFILPPLNYFHRPFAKDAQPDTEMKPEALKTQTPVSDPPPITTKDLKDKEK